MARDPLFLASAVAHKALWPLTASPSFVIIGAQKAGTTSLYDYLSRVPGIRPARRKEVHYFDENYARGRSWYASQFPFSVGPDSRRSWITGEASPYYLLHPWAPTRLAADLPAAKLIVMLRNPVERAYSSWAMRHRMGLEPRTFEQALEREREVYPREHAALLADPTRDTREHRLSSYAVRGLYLDQLLAWEAVTAAERILVLLSERLFVDPEGELARVHTFLGVPADPGVTLPRSNTGRYDQMDPALRARLDEDFHGPNAALAEHLGINVQELGWS